MSHGHMLIKCRTCLDVIVQCRCVDYNKPITWQICEKCNTKERPKPLPDPALMQSKQSDPLPDPHVQEMKALLGGISLQMQTIAAEFEKFHGLRDELIDLDRKINPPPYAADAQPSDGLSEPYLPDAGNQGEKMNEATTEQMIQEKGLTAPRLSPADIDAAIVKEKFYILEDSMHTICVLTLRNGFTVTGESACVSPANFSKEVGEKVAKENARAKIWPLEGYLLKDRLHNASLPLSPA